MSTHTFRINEPPEKIILHAFRAECRHCKDGQVVVLRDQTTFKIMPDNCYCLLCGQRYFVDVPPENYMEWELQQWDQKKEKLKT